MLTPDLWLWLDQDLTPPPPRPPPQYGLQSATSNGVLFEGLTACMDYISPLAMAAVTTAPLPMIRPKLRLGFGLHPYPWSNPSLGLGLNYTPTHGQTQAWDWTAICSTVHATFDITTFCAISRSSAANFLPAGLVLLYHMLCFHLHQASC